ncbi:regulatory protein [Keratinibaculum paraultunense]|uniref:Regulatory protein RecX n=1 Tax=Keratinibaculum paraultunense TaxID=1278232 RepID=A0A4R3KYI9_9FIRM|nr:recombination regulator RecX [Keratinibaculum paraultunense]QQY78968.1 recombination regulator RecX [Keratinibaculum paraultunense]TCS90588.1 regulatory protein [Keratinibaculum paraultunense]
MKITKIEQQKNNKERVNVYIDDKFAFGLMIEIKYKYDLQENMEINEEYIEKVLREEELSKAKDQALKFLTYRQRSEKEIIDKLRKKGFEESIIDDTLNYLKKYKLVDDVEFAKAFMKDKINLNKFGPIRIKHELYKKGIDNTIIEKVLEENDNEDEYNRALNLAKKKLPSYKNDDKNAIYRKLGGFLQRKGYSYDCIFKVLKELVK